MARSLAVRSGLSVVDLEDVLPTSRSAISATIKNLQLKASFLYE
ncbi:hypothetical protein ACN4EG_01845 [Alkalinema pantanalense CENA528]